MSSSPIPPLRGMKKEYRVARLRAPISRACPRSSFTAPPTTCGSGAPRILPAAMRRERHQARITTKDQPMPIRSLLAPVMLATAYGAWVGSERRAPGEDDIDGVLGQHGDQGEQGQGQGLRDVHLEGLGRPGEDEGRAQDGHPGQEGHHGRGQGMEVGKEAHHEPGHRDQAGQGDPEPSPTCGRDLLQSPFAPRFRGVSGQAVSLLGRGRLGGRTYAHFCPRVYGAAVCALRRVPLRGAQAGAGMRSGRR